MKELSIEEKAKAYDGLIERLKDLKFAYRFSPLSDTIEDIFPELAESENERIRKEINPKFKVGDWIVCDELNTAFIVNISDDRYEVEFVDGNKGFPHIDYVDRLFHLWTINNAVYGDVLVCKGNIKGSNGITYERICLFKNLDHAFFTLTKTSNYVEEYAIDVNIDYPDNTVPATKEQKEILFMTMKEAGYEWDSEKKELKKIADKSSWSEEDESMRTRCIGILGKCYLGELPTKVEEELTQNHNKWHSIDEKPVYPCDILYKAPNGNIFLFKYMEDGKPAGPETSYLHSFDDGEWMYLKDVESQSHWKPSEEQLNALHWCVMNVGSTEHQVLQELLEQLEKLKD